MLEEIKYEDIRKGDTIKVVYNTGKFCTTERTAVAHKEVKGEWTTEDDWYTLPRESAYCKIENFMVFLVDRPRKPLPTVSGTVILASKIENFAFGGKAALVLGFDDYWHTLIPQYTFNSERVLEWEHANIVPVEEETK